MSRISIAEKQSAAGIVACACGCGEPLSGEQQRRHRRYQLSHGNRVRHGRNLTRREIWERQWATRLERIAAGPRKPCECGCGELTPMLTLGLRPRRFIWNHHLRLTGPIARAKAYATTRSRPSPLRGRTVPQVVRAKMSAAQRGRVVSDETREKISAANRGTRSVHWRGGVSFLPYPPEFSAALKRRVLRRDDY